MILVFRAQFFWVLKSTFKKQKHNSMSWLDVCAAADIWQDKTNCRIIADKARNIDHTFWKIGKPNAGNMAKKWVVTLWHISNACHPYCNCQAGIEKAASRHAHPCSIQMHVTAACDLENATFFLQFYLANFNRHFNCFKLTYLLTRFW